MFKKAVSFVAVLALALAIPTWAYAVSEPGHFSKPPGGTSIPGNQNHNVCSPPAGFINTGPSYDLSIGDAQTNVGLSAYQQAIQLAKQYGDCVAPNDPSTVSYTCTVVDPGNTRHIVKDCTVSVVKKHVDLGGGPGSSSSYPGIAISCLAQVANPTVVASKVNHATVSYLPSRIWYLNLPVEYSFTDPHINPNITFGQGYNPSNTCYSPNVPYGPNLTEESYVSATVNVSINNATRISTGPVVGAIVASNTGQTIEQFSCPAGQPLVPLSQIPRYFTAGNVDQDLANFYSANHVCNFTPNNPAVAELVETEPTANFVSFTLSQQYMYQVSYSADWSTDTCSASRTFYAKATNGYPADSYGRWGPESCTPDSGTFPSSDVPPTTIPVNAQFYESPSIPVKMVVAVPCFTNSNGVTTCPPSNLNVAN